MTDDEHADAAASQSAAPGDAQAETEREERDTTWIIGAMAMSALLFGTVVYHYLEDWSWVDSFYFSSIALTTVGFGDLTPSSDASKLFTVVYVFGGISLIGLYLNNILKRRAARIERRTRKD